MRNSQAFKSAVAQTLAELARQGVTLGPAAVEDAIEERMQAIAAQLGTQVASTWRYFDAAAFADSLAKSVRDFEQGAEDAAGIGQASMPPLDNPELALVLAGVPDSMAHTGGDLFQVIVNVAVNAWMAGHIHGEDGCEGCEASRGPAGHDWARRMRQIEDMQPGIGKWFDRDAWTTALNKSGFQVTRG
ncbi:hypothetical protein [Streptomyces sp. NPDC050264]|uniref:hypothetical protein n=1 Tax=Streptomyces sp. NPDC050264 TaxID=3155038 RepID=UPI0034383091